MRHRIQKLSKVIRSILLAAFILAPIAVSAVWLSGGEILLDHVPSGMSFELSGDDMLHTGLAPLPLPWQTRLLGLAATMIPAGIAMVALWWLVRLFGCFARGEVFTQSTVRYISRTGWTMVAGVVAVPVHQALLSLILTMHNESGERLVTVSLDMNDLEKLLTATMIILIGWIMEEGRKLRENDDLTI